MYVHVKIADGHKSGIGVSVCKSLCVHRCSPNMSRYVVSFGGCKLNTCFSAKISIFSYDFRLMCAIAFAAFEGGVCAWDSLHSPHITVTTRRDTTREEFIDCVESQREREHEKVMAKSTAATATTIYMRWNADGWVWVSKNEETDVQVVLPSDCIANRVPLR